MYHRAIHISSVNRIKIGQHKPENFSIKFDPVIRLDRNSHYDLALDRATMTFSLHNISDKYNNNLVKYSADNGNTWEDINFTDGMYSYDVLNDYIQEVSERNGDDKEGIKLSLILSSYMVVIELKSRWQIDMRNFDFGDLLGFDHKLLQKTETSVRLPNITNCCYWL